MSDFIIAIILGVAEGVTEFLPVSSTGHLIIVNEWLSFEPGFTAMFDIVIQLGAILAIVLLFRKRLWPLEKPARTLWKKTFIAVVPALVLGALLGGFIEEKLFNPIVVACALIVGGILLIIAERIKKRETAPSVADLTYKKAFAIGLFQCLALIPGTSRAAATIIGGLFLGASRVAAAEFSFFLAIPTMLAASGYSLLKSGFSLTSHDASVLVLGFIISFLVAWAVVKVFISYIQKHEFTWFGYYRIALGIVVLYIFLGL